MSFPIQVILCLRFDDTFCGHYLSSFRLTGLNSHFHSLYERLPDMPYDFASRSFYLGIEAKRLAEFADDIDMFLRKKTSRQQSGPSAPSKAAKRCCKKSKDRALLAF
jgi:hypothetical protein